MGDLAVCVVCFVGTDTVDVDVDVDAGLEDAVTDFPGELCFAGDTDDCVDALAGFRTTP